MNLAVFGASSVLVDSCFQCLVSFPRAGGVGRRVFFLVSDACSFCDGWVSGVGGCYLVVNFLVCLGHVGGVEVG